MAARAPAWLPDERTRRTLSLNKEEDLRDTLALVKTILSKIVEAPEEKKFRRLRASSRAVQTRLLGRPGGRELLKELGAKSRDDAVEFGGADAATLAGDRVEIVRG